MQRPDSAPATEPPPWGPARDFGTLFGDAFRQTWAQRAWLAPLAILCLMPVVVVRVVGDFAVFVAFDHERFVRHLVAGEAPLGLLRPLLGGLIALGVAWLVVVSAMQVVLGAGLYATLAESRRRRFPGFDGALANGLRAAWTFFCVSFAVGLRILGWWALCFVLPIAAGIVVAAHDAAWALAIAIPAALGGMAWVIIRSLAWSFAVPARLAGDAPDAAAAIRLSEEAMVGRKGYLFAFQLLLGLIFAGVGFVMGLVLLPLSLAGGALGQHIVGDLTYLAAGLLGVVIPVGQWLAYADAVARRQPGSAAAPWAFYVPPPDDAPAA